jgi:CDP-diacylglycerol---serine O-phosphatidyltransferase
MSCVFDRSPAALKPITVHKMTPLPKHPATMPIYINFVLMEKSIPNILTLGNLFCGFFGIIVTLSGHDPALGGLMIFIGAIFDLLDGYSARLLKAKSPIGKELDSLADIVTFGVLPACIAYVLLLKTNASWLGYLYLNDPYIPLFALLPFLLPITAAWRLAKFNIDETQTYSFRGLPTPANGLFWGSLPLILAHDVYAIDFNVVYMSELILNPYLISGLVLFFSWLMVSPLSLFSLKMKNYSWRDNWIVYLFLILSVILFIFLFWLAVPVIIMLYLILSYFNKAKAEADEIQSAN